jgi:hypothetical protein
MSDQNAEMVIDSKEFDLLVLAASQVQPVEAMIVTDNPKVKDYWPVTEYGSLEGHRPWPRPWKRTTRGGGGRIFSKQAKGGWVFKYGMRFIEFLEIAYNKAAERTGGLPLQRDLADAVNEAGDKTLGWLKKTAPVDKGDLRDSLTVKKAT